MHSKHISNLLLTQVVGIQHLQEIRRRSRMLLSEVREEEAEVWCKIVHEATILGTHEESYVLLHRACYLCVLMAKCYIYHAHSAPSNLQVRSCLDTILVSTSGLVDVIATACDS